MENAIRKYLISKNFNTAADETYSHIDEWLSWYQNEVKKFHQYKIWNGTTTTTHDRYRLGMAKTVCEDWANLLLNEKVGIKAGNYSKRLEEILAANNFYVKGNQLVELSFALGTGAFVEYKDAAGDIVIDFIRADMIYPLSWENGEITECAFGSSQTVKEKEQIYLQIHRFGREEGEAPEAYYIENVYIDAESGKEIELPEGLVPVVDTGSTTPLFQIITPNICNNIDMDSPMGISIFANAISQLKGCDITYDSYVNEFVLGRKRILVPMSMAKMHMQEDGTSAPIFDSNDTVYYMMPADRNGDMKLTEVDMKIRAQEHELGVQKSLDLLSSKVGMGAGRYSFEKGGMKTATEVISDKSDLYQNRQKHCILISAALINMVRAVSFLDKGKSRKATVDFDDSIIEDTNATIDKNIKLVSNGLRSKLTAIMEINKCSEEEAKQEMERIAQDGQITGQDIDWTGGDADEDTSEEEQDGEDIDEPSGKPKGS